MKQSKMDLLTVTKNALTCEDYCRLREKVNFQPYSPEDVRKALEGSLFTLSILQEQKTVGMARVVGDGGWPSL